MHKLAQQGLGDMNTIMNHLEYPLKDSKIKHFESIYTLLSAGTILNLYTQPKG